MNKVNVVLERIASAALESGRKSQDVTILLATKTQSVEVISAVICTMRDAGVARVLVGENRVQELAQKADFYAELAAVTSLHFIGNLQKNKINQLLTTPVACVETVDSLELAEALSKRCQNLDRSLDVMVQVNVSGEPTKSGCLPSEAGQLAMRIANLPNLRLTGFMCIGVRPDIVAGEITNAADIRAGYRVLREIRDAVIASGEPGTATATELSMGMSTDLELAIAEGSTIVRVGTAIFGQRPRN